MSAYTYKAGELSNGADVYCCTIVLDATNADGKGIGTTFGAGDTVSIPVPQGLILKDGSIKTVTAWTGNISIGTVEGTGTAGGTAASATSIFASAAPSATVGAYIPTAALVTAGSILLSGAAAAGTPSVTAAHVLVTIASANTTGKLQINLYGYSPAQV